MTAEVCRETTTGSSAAVATHSTCMPVVHVTVAPGPSSATDMLPPPLQADPVSLLTYRIQIFNSTGHSAGKSSVVACAAAGLAPVPVSGMKGTLSEQGVILEWENPTMQTGDPADFVDFRRVDLLASPPAEKKTKQTPMPAFGKGRSVTRSSSEEEDTNEAHLRASDATNGANSVGGTVDTTVVVNHTYRYAARRIRTVDLGTHHLELQSEPLASLTLSVRDTFPPKAPSGLATIAVSAAADSIQREGKAGPYVDLSWEPNGEADLAGYRVYRQLEGPDGSAQGPLKSVSEVPIAVPAYRDLAVRAGQGYIYSVTAVDAAGNESAPSAKALEIFPPATGTPPH